MSEIHEQILEMLESGFDEFYIARVLNIPVAWVYEALDISGAWD